MVRKKNRKGKKIDGFLIVDKPKGITSNAVLQRVKHMFDAAKAGHTGSLDPLATGVLPICFGEATKFSQYLLESDKEYDVTAKLGEKTATADADGDVLLTRAVPDISHGDLQSLAVKFTGVIEQTPSMYSALKHKGTPLYKLARQGQEVERKPRQVTIYAISLLDLQLPYCRFKVRCSKGTYIRNLMEDMGEALGCGAHVTELRRVSAGPYGIAQSVTLERLEHDSQSGNHASMSGLILPILTAIAQWQTVKLNVEAAECLLQGRVIQLAKTFEAGLVGVVEEDTHKFLGVGEVLGNGTLTPKRLVSC